MSVYADNTSNNVLAPTDDGYSKELPLLFGADIQNAKNKVCVTSSYDNHSLMSEVLVPNYIRCCNSCDLLSKVCVYAWAVVS